jgi:hypothetical protein
MSAFCQRDGCSKTWDRDPVLEVACPSCSADVGVKCRRPSGHGGNFVHPHDKRDLLADAEGHYGECPKGICGTDRPGPPPGTEAEQLTLGEVGQ